jgi:crossover junction endodeoxyribonuclease RuvC
MSLGIIGVDPGFTGAVAFLDSKSMSLSVYDMPTLQVKSGKKMRSIIDLHALNDLLEPEEYDTTIAWVEQVGAMRGQGVTSMFRFGEGFGALQMGVIAKGHQMITVTPQRWKKHFGLPGKSKEGAALARALAANRFPANASQFARVKDDGRADAALIALYGLETSR